MLKMIKWRRRLVIVREGRRKGKKITIKKGNSSYKNIYKKQKINKSTEKENKKRNKAGEGGNKIK